MSTMNILSATLIILIVAAGLALFFGMRAAQAAEVETPVFTVTSSAEAGLWPTAIMDAAAMTEVE